MKWCEFKKFFKSQTRRNWKWGINTYPLNFSFSSHNLPPPQLLLRKISMRVCLFQLLLSHSFYNLHTHSIFTVNWEYGYGITVDHYPPTSATNHHQPHSMGSPTISRLSTAVRSYFCAFFKLSTHSQKYEVKQCCAFFWSLTESWLGQTVAWKSLLTWKNI